MKLFKHKLLNLLPVPIKALLGAYRMRSNPYYARLSSLPYKHSGVTADNVPFVELADGLQFFGYRPNATQRAYYRYFLGKRAKELLHQDCINVAYDISLRYFGPVVQQDLLNQGKYYDFSPGETVLEIGAYIGFYAMRAAQIVGPSGRVVAVEAIAENAALLERNVAANEIENIDIVNMAAWHSPGSLMFYRRGRQQASAISSVIEDESGFEVSCDSVDNIVKSVGLKQVDFARVQVNGAEREVLDGMQATLATLPRILVAAPYTRNGHNSWPAIEKQLAEQGFSVKVYGSNVFAEKDVKPL